MERGSIAIQRGIADPTDNKSKKSLLFRQFPPKNGAKYNGVYEEQFLSSDGTQMTRRSHKSSQTSQRITNWTLECASDGTNTKNTNNILSLACHVRRERPCTPYLLPKKVHENSLSGSEAQG